MKSHYVLALLLVLSLQPGLAASLDSHADVLVVLSQEPTSPTILATERLRLASGIKGNVTTSTTTAKSNTNNDATIIIGTGAATAELKKEWARHPEANPDSYLVRTLSEEPLVIAVSGNNDRGTLYAAYCLADMIKGNSEITGLDLFFEPKVKERYVSFGATTHGRREYRPELHHMTLKELPRFGYNGVIIYPGGGTPIGRHSSPVMEDKDGKLYLDAANTSRWKNWLGDIESYDHNIMMTVPPLVPPGYDKKAIQAYYRGGAEPDGYISNLKTHFRKYLELLTQAYPEVDLYMFNSTEGATFGSNVRFFGHPDPQSSTTTYLANNETVMKAYFDVITEFFGDDIDKVTFWTHSFGLTSDGIAKMREVLFQYPRVTIIEDDFWNNNLWPFDLPAMAYLPPDLRAKASEKNPFALFQIATDGEYYGGGSLPNAYPDSHIRSAREGIERKARMIIQRLDLHDRTEYGTLFGTMEIVPLAASRQLWTPVPDTPEIWLNWARRRFGENPAPHVVNALQQSRDIIRYGLSCNGIDLLAVGSEFTPRLWYKNESGLSRFNLFSRPGKPFVAINTGAVITSEEFTAFQMNTTSIDIDQYRENQAIAMKAARKGLAEIESAKADLHPKDYDMLTDVFNNGIEVLKALQLLGEAAYGANLKLDNFDKVENPPAYFNDAVTNLESFLDKSSLAEPMKANIRKIIQNYTEIGKVRN